MNDRDNNIGNGKYLWSYIIKLLFIGRLPLHK